MSKTRFGELREGSTSVRHELPHLIVQDGLHSFGAVQEAVRLAVNELVTRDLPAVQPNLAVTRVLTEAFPENTTLAEEVSTLIQSLVIKCLAAIANREAPFADLDPVEFVSTLLLLIGTNIRLHGLSPETMQWFEAARQQIVEESTPGE